MRRKHVWALALFIIIVYFSFCVYLFSLLSTDLLKTSGINDLEQKRDYLWEFVNPVAECQCSAFGYEPLIPDSSNGDHKQKHHLGNDTCSFTPSSQRADIEMPKVISEMSLDYPSYVWTHSGWVQQMDTNYDSSQWDTAPLEVYVVPFSHHDPGWINTYETYYNSWTKATLDLVVEQLTYDPNLTFVWAEVLFLERWYKEADAKTQAAFKKLLQNQRFEIVSGGWVMSDEAITHYGAFLGQLMEGQLWLHDELDYRVHSAWGLDPFGHSSTVAHLLRLSGVESLYIQRTHYAVKKHLAYKKQLEFVWQQDWDQSAGSSIFCHLSPYMLYSIQYSCGPDINVCCQFDFTHKKCWQWGSYQPAKPITADNVRTRAYELLDQLRKKAQFFRHNLLLFPFGDDFRFSNKKEWNQQFKNLTTLFWYMNSHPEMKVQVKFSTLGKYLEAVKAKVTESGGWTPPTLKGDFFTYSDRSDQYWSGYFSSRPIMKRLVRILQSHLRAAELLFSLAAMHDQRLDDSKSHWNALLLTYKGLQTLRRDLSLLQHHDAITGTSRLSVVSDSLNSLKDSLEISRKVVSKLISMLLQFPQEHVMLNMLEEQMSGDGLPRLRMMELKSADEKGESIMIVFNPLASEVTQIIRLLVPSPDIQVLDVAMNLVKCQVSPVINQSTVFIEGQFELHFEVKVPGMGFVSYRIRKLSPDDPGRCFRSRLKMINFHLNHRLSSLFNISWHETSQLSISNHHLTVTLCKCTYLMQNIILRSQMIPYKAEMQFAFYQTGNWINPFRDKSGAYIFLPDGPAKNIVCKNCRLVIVEGPIVSSATTWMNITSQTVMLYNTHGVQGSGVHVTNHVDLHSYDNVEVVLKLKTSAANSGYFYTDQNGFQMHRRQTLSRLPIQGNFYPMTSAAFIEDERIRFSLLSVQSHAVASLEPGTLEVILDRRLAQDDWRGLKEGIQDNVPTLSRFTLVLEQWKRTSKLPNTPPPFTAYPSRMVQQLSVSLENPLILLSSSTPQPSLHLLGAYLPCDVHLVNLRSLGIEENRKIGHKVLLTLHRIGVECEAEGAVTVDCKDSQEIFLRAVFQNFTIKAVDEMTLTGTTVVHHTTPETPVTLGPMEIKTWKLALQ